MVIKITTTVASLRIYICIADKCMLLQIAADVCTHVNVFTHAFASRRQFVQQGRSSALRMCLQVWTENGADLSCQGIILAQPVFTSSKEDCVHLKIPYSHERKT